MECEFRYSTGARWGDLWFVLLAGWVITLPVFPLWFLLTPEPENVFALYGLTFLIITAGIALPRIWLRWWSHVRLDASGCRAFRNRSRPIWCLAWEDVETVWLLGKGSLLLEAGRRRYRIPASFEDMPELRSACLGQLLPVIRKKVRARVDAQDRLEFRMAGRRSTTHLLYFAVTILMAGSTLTLARWALDVGWVAWGAVGILFLYGLCLWAARGWVNWRSARIVVDGCGILVERLNGRAFIPWQERPTVEWGGQGDLLLATATGCSVAIPGRLGNILLFVETVQQGPPGMKT